MSTYDNSEGIKINKRFKVQQGLEEQEELEEKGLGRPRGQLAEWAHLARVEE